MRICSLYVALTLFFPPSLTTLSFSHSFTSCFLSLVSCFSLLSTISHQFSFELHPYSVSSFLFLYIYIYINCPFAFPLTLLLSRLISSLVLPLSLSLFDTVLFASFSLAGLFLSGRESVCSQVPAEPSYLPGPQPGSALLFNTPSIFPLLYHLIFFFFLSFSGAFSQSTFELSIPPFVCLSHLLTHLPVELFFWLLNGYLL